MLQKDTFQVQALLEPAIKAMGYELLGCVYIPRGRRPILRVYIDSEHGINLTDCEKVSRQISAILDVEDPLPGAYVLEVSSPGEQRPLFTRKHFERFIGSRVQITLHAPQNNRRHFTGILCGTDDSGVIITTIEQQEITLTWLSIAKANLLPETRKVGEKH